MPIKQLSRSFCHAQFLKAYYLLKQQSLTEFSLHMEIKLHSDGTAYLHFHVVLGGVKDLRFFRKIWGRQVKYETAINPISLGFYISKYASKTPTFSSESQKIVYLSLVYKMQMHRFSVGVPPSSKKISPWSRMESIRAEIYACCYRDSYLNSDSEKLYYHPLLNTLDRPPDYRGKPWLKDFNTSSQDVLF